MVNSIGAAQHPYSVKWCAIHNRYEAEGPYLTAFKWCPIHQRMEEVLIQVWEDDSETDKE